MPRAITPARINEKYLTVKMAADLLDVTTVRVHQLIEDGRLESFSIVDRICIRRAQVVALVQQRAK